MIAKQSTSAMIREAQTDIGSCATNSEIKAYCTKKFGITPISQTIYSAIGSEWSRTADNVSARELADSKRFVRQKFDGDKDKAILAINIIGRIQ